MVGQAQHWSSGLDARSLRVKDFWPQVGMWAGGTCRSWRPWQVLWWVVAWGYSICSWQFSNPYLTLSMNCCTMGRDRTNRA